MRIALALCVLLSGSGCVRPSDYRAAGYAMIAAGGVTSAAFLSHAAYSSSLKGVSPAAAFKPAGVACAVAGAALVGGIVMAVLNPDPPDERPKTEPQPEVRRDMTVLYERLWQVEKQNRLMRGELERLRDRTPLQKPWNELKP